MSNALVSLAQIDRAAAKAAAPAPDVRATSRASADFVAHLIATLAQAPQTRARRRADPDQAIAAYGALGHWPIPAGGMLSRSL